MSCKEFDLTGKIVMLMGGRDASITDDGARGRRGAGEGEDVGEIIEAFTTGRADGFNFAGV
jgi:hypothetical protein